MTEVVTDRRARYGHVSRRHVVSWAGGKHWPEPVLRDDGWRCYRCLRRLNTYRADDGTWRLRHYWRDA